MRILPILFNTEMVRALLDGRKTVTRRVIKPQPPIDFRCPQADNSESRWWWTDRDGDDDMMGWWPSYENGLIPPYEPGDILYVRETWYYEYHMHDRTAGEPDLPGGRYSQRYIFKADQPDYPVDVGVGPHGWKPSIHMPKEAARIFLRVKTVRVERLQDSFFAPISPIFALQAEGMDIGDDCRECIATYGNPCCVDTVDEDGSKLYGGDCGILDEVRENYAELWDSTVKKADWDKYDWRADPWVWVIEFERVENPELLEVKT